MDESINLIKLEQEVGAHLGVDASERRILSKRLGAHLGVDASERRIH